MPFASPESARQWRQANRERLRLTDAEWRKAHPERTRISAARYRAKNRDITRVKAKAYRLSDGGKARYACYLQDPGKRLFILAGNAVRRATKLGLALDEGLREHLMARAPKLCECCAVGMDYSIGRGRTKRHRSPSLDRLDNTKGYTIDNVRVICWRCNDLKSDASLAELVAVVRYMRTGT